MIISFPFNPIDEVRYKRYAMQIEPFIPYVDGIIITANHGEYFKTPKKVDLFIKHEGKYFKNLRRRNKLPIINSYHIMKWVNNIAKWSVDYIEECDLSWCLSGAGYQQFLHTRLKKYANIPIIHRMRGDGILERKIKKTRILIKFLNNICHHYSLRHYDYHIPIKYEFTNRLIEWGVPEEKISTPIGLGIDTKMFEVGDYPNDLTVGYFGRLAKEKGIDFMIQVMEATPEINYIVAGSSREGTYEFPSNCEYLGYINHDEMNSAFNRCNLIMLCSYIEGLPNIILETYSTGRALITSNDAFPSTLPLFGYMLPHNLNYWVNFIRSLDIDYLKMIGTNAREWAKNYSWDNYAKRCLYEWKNFLDK
jgi:glycosyltransferase involved in cell wall biosynthesis